MPNSRSTANYPEHILFSTQPLLTVKPQARVGHSIIAAANGSGINVYPVVGTVGSDMELCHIAALAGSTFIDDIEGSNAVCFRASPDITDNGAGRTRLFTSANNIYGLVYQDPRMAPGVLGYFTVFIAISDFRHPSAPEPYPGGATEIVEAHGRIFGDTLFELTGSRGPILQAPSHAVTLSTARR